MSSNPLKSYPIVFRRFIFSQKLYYANNNERSVRRLFGHRGQLPKERQEIPGGSIPAFIKWIKKNDQYFIYSYSSDTIKLTFYGKQFAKGSGKIKNQESQTKLPEETSKILTAHILQFLRSESRKSSHNLKKFELLQLFESLIKKTKKSIEEKELKHLLSGQKYFISRYKELYEFLKCINGVTVEELDEGDKDFSTANVMYLSVWADLNE